MKAITLGAALAIAISASAAANTYTIAGTGTAGYLASGYSVVGVTDIDGDGMADIIRQDSGGNMYVGNSLLGVLPSGFYVVGGGTDNDRMTGLVLVQDAFNNVVVINPRGARNDYIGQAPAGYRIVAVGGGVTQGPLLIAWQNAAGDTLRWRLSAQPQYTVQPGNATDYGVMGKPIFGYEYLSHHDTLGGPYLGYPNLYHQTLMGTSLGAYIYSASPAPSGYVPVAVDDFNGDSQSDIIWYNPTTQDITIGATTSCASGTVYTRVAPAVTYSSLGAVPAGFTFVGSGDLNGDGAIDLLFYNSSTYELRVWLGAKSGTDTCSSIMFPAFSFNQARP